MKTPCQGFFGKILGHVYEPIFEEEQTGSTLSSSNEFLEMLGKAIGVGDPYSIEPITDLIDSHRTYKTVYSCHVCLRCGHRIKREE